MMRPEPCYVDDSGTVPKEGDSDQVVEPGAEEDESS